MTPSANTLLTASNALSSLLLRRQKQKQKQSGSHSGTSQTTVKGGASRVKQNKRRRTSTRILNEEEECEGVKERKQEKIEVNVKILKELSRRGKKEEEIMDEIMRLRREKELALRGKGKKPERPMEEEGESD